MRSLILFAFICGLLGAPTLCAAGAFTHPCDCGEAIECNHEDDCADDPCVDVFAPRENEVDPVPAESPADGLAALSATSRPEKDCPLRVPLVVPKPNLPCPDSALPLLN